MWAWMESNTKPVCWGKSVYEEEQAANKNGNKCFGQNWVSLSGRLEGEDFSVVIRGKGKGV